MASPGLMNGIGVNDARLEEAVHDPSADREADGLEATDNNLHPMLVILVHLASYQLDEDIGEKSYHIERDQNHDDEVLLS